MARSRSAVSRAQAPEGGEASGSTAPEDVFEAGVDRLANYESSDLPERTKAALRLADAISLAPEIVDEDFYRKLRVHFSDDQILDLGMSAAFFSGWQRFIEAFKIVPDRWADGDPMPWAQTTPPHPPHEPEHEEPS